MTAPERAPEVRRLARRERVAALLHRCELCGGQMLRGQRHVEVVANVDAAFSVWKHHLGRGTCLFEKSGRKPA